MILHVCVVGMAAWLLVLGTALAEPMEYWCFDEGQPGETAADLTPEIDAETLKAEAGVYEDGTTPVFDTEVPATTIWDGGTFLPANPENVASLRFSNEGAEQITVDGTTYVFANIPVYDSPVAITDKRLLSFEPARQKEKHENPMAAGTD